MAKSLTARFGLQRWSVDSDEQQRSEFDNDAAQIDLLAALYGQGTLAGKGPASAANQGKFWMITDATGGGVVGQLYYSDGTTWRGPFADKASADAAYLSRADVGSAGVTTFESTASATYADLTTVGPSVTVTPRSGGSGLALVLVKAYIQPASAGSLGLIGVDVSGGTTLSAADTRSAGFQAYANNAIGQVSGAFAVPLAGTTATTFRMKYRSTSGSVSFQDRLITVVPL